MPRNSLGQRIQDVVGGMGITFGQPIQYTWAFGYPAGSPFNGQTLWKTNGPAYDDGALHHLHGKQHDRWRVRRLLAHPVQRQHGMINGHNSFGVDAIPDRMYSPYYGLATKNFYLSVESLTV